MAAVEGEAHPAGVQLVRSTRQAANAAASGATVDSDQAVYVLILHGHFTGYTAKVPPGQPLPQGSALVLVVDATTNRVTDYGITNHPPSIHALGPVTNLGDL